MTDELDARIRTFLSRIHDAAPMAPRFDSICAVRRRSSTRPTSVLVLATAGVAAAGAVGVVALRTPTSSTPPSDAVESSIETADPETTTSPSDQDSHPPTQRPDNPAVPDNETLLAMLYSTLGISTTRDDALAADWGPTESEIAACMERAGFVYRRVPTAMEVLAVGPLAAMTPEQFASRYGFGIAAAALGEISVTPPDPNVPFVEAMPDGLRFAWSEAEKLCTGGGPGSDAWKFTDAWQVAFDSFHTRVGSDPTIVAALQSWQECMQSAGYTESAPADMRRAFRHRSIGASAQDLEALAAEEIEVAVETLPCDVTYIEAYRGTVDERFGEFMELLIAALDADSAPAGRG